MRYYYLFLTAGKNGPLFPIRYLMAIMGSIGLAILYGFKVNASVAIVAMVNHTAVHINNPRSPYDNTSTVSANVCQFDDASNVTKITGEV